jgi:glycosyltransferase involved in cell wall biosynthesis
MADLNSRCAGSLVSVVMPVFNGLRTVRRAYSSLAAQSFAHWELLAVDDGSTDGTRVELLQLAAHDTRVRVLFMEENIGPGAARNKALENAAGELVTYLDCDDEYYPNYLETAGRLLSRADVLMCGYDVVDDRDPRGPIRSWGKADTHRSSCSDGNMATAMRPALLGRALVLRRRMRASYAPELGRRIFSPDA